jgi:methylmalonyl-CoA mutase cobalamin-binding subunit
MTNAIQSVTAAHSIADIERDTGLPKDTLRVWERRYGFPNPVRDAQGERRYDDEQLLRLRHLRRLLDAGHRPGRVVSLPLAQLLQLDTQAEGVRIRAEENAAVPTGLAPDTDAWMQLLLQHKAHRLYNAMSQHLLHHGLAALVRDGIAPMNERVGQAWIGGQLAVFEEHLYTELVQRLLRSGLAQVAASRALHAPRVLLSTVPGEMHGLGLLMAECMLVLEGCETVSLGVQTPLIEIANAARLCRADVVALGFSAALNPREARASLAQVRSLLPDTMALWTGGQCPGLQRSTRGRPSNEAPLSGHTHMPRLEDIARGVALWRAGHPSLAV